jgi:ribonucleoside-diphosphate reductase alpha chain
MSAYTDQGLSLPAEIVKRDGATVPFNLDRIRRAIDLCFDSEGVETTTPQEVVVQAVANTVAAKYAFDTPHVEQVQDIVEQTLLGLGEFSAARHYIVYREEHARDRVLIPAEVKAAFDLSASYFPTDVQQFMFFDKYARYNWELGRRETWVETVDRVVAYLAKLSRHQLEPSVYEDIRSAILRMDVMPSMRLLSQAGTAAEKNSMSIYNCSFMPVKDIDSFAEMMLISMAGCGVGFSVESQYVEQFPRIKRQTGVKRPAYVVDDSTEGWANALRYGLQTWFEGEDVDFDTSLVREAGSVLITKGGRASGPGPLKEVLAFARKTVLARQGSFLRTLDCHDLACVACGAAVSGGVRRTAAISLFDWDDHEMRTCKDGGKLDANPWRWNANNSAVWPDSIDQIDLVDQMREMYRNRRGEPGIFSRANANRLKPERREECDFGTNPCGEINLRPYQFCNLSIAVARPDDSSEDLRAKVEIATIIGTIQSMATHFPGLRPEWKENCERERLLGVDVSGQQDCRILTESHPDMVQAIFGMLKKVAIDTNAATARRLGINPSVAITCNKPNGNSSQLLNCSSGIHRRHAPFYIRNMRVSPHTPIFRVLAAAGVPMDPENGQNRLNATSWVIHFPVKSPEHARFRRDATAVEQMEWWKTNKLYWTEHNPSVTINYDPDELLDVMAWVWANKDIVGGMAFLPNDDAQYAQMPYEEITEEEYEKRAAAFPEIDWSLIYAYEREDMTTAAQELACMSGSCEYVPPTMEVVR